MKRICLMARMSICGLLAIFAAQSVLAQSKDSQALRWFEAGVKESDAKKKIEAYNKAIELDPNFVEALYNLGMVYKKQQDYQRAEQFLKKAYAAKPDALNNEAKLQILYELAITYKKLGKAKNAEQALAGAKQLSPDPNIQGKIAFEMGRLLYEQGRYNEIPAELQPVEKLNPANKNDLAELIQLAENILALQRLYAAAEKAKIAGKLAEAKALFEQVKAKSPGYKNVDALIAELDSLLNVETKKSVLATLYDQAQKYEAEGKLEMAIASYENLLKQNPGHKDAGAKLQNARQQLEQNQRNATLESEYANGLVALKTRDWAGAMVAFEKVQAVEQNYRDVRKKIAEAQRGLLRENTETLVARYYADGITAMNNNDYGGALAALEKVQKLNPNYRDVASLLQEIENALRPSTNMANMAAEPVPVDSLYQAGMASLEKGDWVRAVVDFEKVQILQPDYRDVVDQLALAKASLSRVEQSPVAASGKSGNASLYVGGAVAALVVLPCLGFIMFSPVMRARFQIFRGNYSGAAQIFERALAQHPTRIKLYAALADIYLLLGRNDEQAIRVYKTVLQLNLATNNLDAINTIVAQNYLSEGRTDTDAIEVLEGALKAEKRRHRNGGQSA